MNGPVLELTGGGSSLKCRPC